jgi:hypothetical protein
MAQDRRFFYSLNWNEQERMLEDACRMDLA